MPMASTAPCLFSILQWMVAAGPFRYDFLWLAGESDNTELVASAKRQFVQFYRPYLDSFDFMAELDVQPVDKSDG